MIGHGENVSFGGSLGIGPASLRRGNLGELDVVARYRDWQIFGTLTFSGASAPSATACRKHVFAHLYRCANILKIPFRRLCWVLRVEHGEKTDRIHYHFLLGGKIKGITVGTCFALNALWEGLPRAGMSRHRVFDSKPFRENGVNYVVSCLANEGTAGANFYELSKFGLRGSDLTLSNSLCRAIGGRRVVVER